MQDPPDKEEECVSTHMSRSYYYYYYTTLKRPCIHAYDEYPSRGGTARLPPWRLMTHPLTASSAEVSSSPPEIDESEIDESDE